MQKKSQTNDSIRFQLSVANDDCEKSYFICWFLCFYSFVQLFRLNEFRIFRRFARRFARLTSFSARIILVEDIA